MEIALGCVAFIFFFMFDMAKLKFKQGFSGIFFLIGVLLVSFATIRIFMQVNWYYVIGIKSTVFILLSAFSFAFMFYCLFFALPFDSTYKNADSTVQTISHGVYALCRHPGVLGFMAGYFFIYAATKSSTLFTAFVVWSLFDIWHVYVQDVYYFPKTLAGYNEYKKTTPFLIPNIASMKKCFGGGE